MSPVSATMSRLLAVFGDIVAGVDGALRASQGLDPQDSGQRQALTSLCKITDDGVKHACVKYCQFGIADQQRIEF